MRPGAAVVVDKTGRGNARNCLVATRIQTHMSGSGGREGTEETPARAAVLGPVLKRFCEEQGIDPIEFDVESSFVKRYLRVAPGPDAERVTNALISRLGANRVRWLPGFLALPLSVPLAAQPEYHAAHVFGMDAASGAGVYPGPDGRARPRIAACAHVHGLRATSGPRPRPTQRRPRAGPVLRRRR